VQQVRLATSISGFNAGLMACEQRWLQALQIFHHIGEKNHDHWGWKKWLWVNTY
jgi:hypothetical protein